MILREVVVASGNAGKLREFEVLFAQHLPQVRRLDLKEVGLTEEPEETGDSFAANAELKAKFYLSQLDKPVLADDSGLEVLALQGHPGVRSARYAGPQASDQENIKKLLRELDKLGPGINLAARFVCALVLALPDGQLYRSEGFLDGQITFEPRGTQGFGYNPVFWVPPKGKTLAQMSVEEKLDIDHRAQAFKKLAKQVHNMLEA